MSVQIRLMHQNFHFNFHKSHNSKFNNSSNISNTLEIEDVTNLSNLKLFPDEISVLEVGWNFCPSSRILDKDKLTQVVIQFFVTC